MASSHAEAPFIKQYPKVDATDYYLFNSYEPGRADYVTLNSQLLAVAATVWGTKLFQHGPQCAL